MVHCQRVKDRFSDVFLTYDTIPSMKQDASLRVVVVGILVVCVISFGIYAKYSRPALKKLTPVEQEGIQSFVTTHPSGLIYASVPQAGTSVSGTVTVLGMARGQWFFEGSFPVSVIDANGKVLGSGVASAEGEWMTEEFVPYTAKIEIKEKPATKQGAIILSRDNPAGGPESFLTIPVTFKAK
jgi:hypothetical protein